MPMYRILFAVAAFVALVPVARADTELRDRMVAASEQMGENMLDVIRICAPGIDMSGVEVEYTPRMTESVACVIETHIDRVGRAETVEMVEQAEAMAQRSLSSLQEMAELQQEFPRLSDPILLEINQACGTLEASRELAMNRLMQENTAELAACFAE